MPARVRLNKQQLIDLIYETEQGGNDATELRDLLAAVSSEKEGEKAEDNDIEVNRDLYRYALGLFVSGEITDEMLASISEYDAKYSVSKLQAMLEERQLSTVGQKHILCARLLAYEKGQGKA